MTIPKWIVICMVLLGAGVIAQLALILNLRSDLKVASEKTERLSDRFEEIAFETKSDKNKSPSVGDGELTDLKVTVASALRRLDALESQGGSGSDLDEAISRNLSEMIANRTTENVMLAGFGIHRGKNFRPLMIDTLAERLGMSEEQKTGFTNTIKRLKKGMLELSEAANKEDAEFIKELDALIKEPSSKPKDKIEKIREKLSSKNAPGFEVSYLETITQFRNQAIAEIEGLLSEEQLQQLVKTPFSIFNVGVNNAARE